VCCPGCRGLSHYKIDQPKQRCRVRPSRLGTPSGVRRELAWLYLDARKDRGNPNAAAKLVYILPCLHKAIETEMVEHRIVELEKLAAHRERKRCLV
jgi:hypothetical protein